MSAIAARVPKQQLFRHNCCDVPCGLAGRAWGQQGMADRLGPTGFWSYTTSDDASADGHLSALRIRIAKALQLQVSRPPVSIFQDKNAIPLGTEWEKQIYRALDQSSFLLPIVTPGFLQSEWCCKEVLYFRERETALDRTDLIWTLAVLGSVRRHRIQAPPTAR